MNKKIGITLILICAVLFTGFGCNKKDADNPISDEIETGKSLIDIAKDNGETVTDKETYLSDCEKLDEDMQDYCFGMGAIYYRDASFCKLIDDSETKEKCTEETIEKWYADLNNGTTPTMPTTEGLLIPGNYECEDTDSESMCKQFQANGMIMACSKDMPAEEKDNCFGIIALQLQDISLCDRISNTERKEECREVLEVLE